MLLNVAYVNFFSCFYFQNYVYIYFLINRLAFPAENLSYIKAYNCLNYVYDTETLENNSLNLPHRNRLQVY